MWIKKQQLELDMKELTGCKLGKEHNKAIYCHPAYLTYMQSTSCKMPAGWITSWNQDCWEKDRHTEVWNLISQRVGDGTNEELLYSLSPHPLLRLHPSHQPPPISLWNGKSSLFPSPRVRGRCSRRKEQILEWEHEQASSCVANCLNIMEFVLLWFCFFFFVGKLFIQCWLTPEP